MNPNNTTFLCTLGKAIVCTWQSRLVDNEQHNCLTKLGHVCCPSYTPNYFNFNCQTYWGGACSCTKWEHQRPADFDDFDLLSSHQMDHDKDWESHLLLVTRSDKILKYIQIFIQMDSQNGPYWLAKIVVSAYGTARQAKKCHFESNSSAKDT